MFSACDVFMTLTTDLQPVIYTQTKKKRPIFMVLYLTIQLRCYNKNKTKMFIKRRTHKNWLLIDFIFVSWVFEPNVQTAFSIIIRKLFIKK